MPAPKGHPPYPGCETGGRPKKYTTEFLDNEADELKKWMKNNNNIFIEDFCYERDYHESRIDEFVRDNEKFSLAYNMLKMRQKTALFRGGLTKKYGYPMCALILSWNHKICAKEQIKDSSSLEMIDFAIKFHEHMKNSHNPVVEE